MTRSVSLTSVLDSLTSSLYTFPITFREGIVLSKTDITADDLREGAKRIRWWQMVVPAAAVFMIFLSQKQLSLASQSAAARIAWMLSPLPFVLANVWSIVRNERAKSELERQIARDAALKTLLATIVGLLVLAQVDAAYGTAGSIMPYHDLWFLPLLAYVVFSVLELHRFTRQ